MGNQSRVVRVTDYNAGDPLGAAVGMESVGLGYVISMAKNQGPCGRYTFLFYILPLARLCPFSNSLAKDGHKLAIAGVHVTAASVHRDHIGGWGGPPMKSILIPSEPRVTTKILFHA